MSEQLDRLARRITWLDRYRRPLAILLTAIVTALLLRVVMQELPANWPRAHIVAIAVMFAVVAWYVLETFLGFVIAWWETDHASMTRPAGLPRATIIRRSARRSGMSARRRA